MFEHDFEKIRSAVSTHSENLKGFGFSAKKLAENPKKLAGFKPQDPQLFGCMVQGQHPPKGHLYSPLFGHKCQPWHDPTIAVAQSQFSRRNITHKGTSSLIVGLLPLISGQYCEHRYLRFMTFLQNIMKDQDQSFSHHQQGKIDFNTEFPDPSL